MPRVDIDAQLEEPLTLVLGKKEFIVRDMPVEAFVNGLKLADELSKTLKNVSEEQTTKQDAILIYTSLRKQLAYFLGLDENDPALKPVGIKTAQKAIQAIVNWMTGEEGEGDQKQT